MINHTEDIKSLSYADFIAIMNLKNTSLGGEFAVDYWISKSDITDQANILEIACHSGFNIKYCLLKTNACGVGLDISKYAIENAKKEKSKAKFIIGDAENLEFNANQFTHVICGMAFAFIKDKHKTLKEAVKVLKDKGYLLTSTVCFTKEQPIELLKRIECVFDIQVESNWNYQWWFKFFSKYFKLKSEVTIIDRKTNYNYEKLKDYVYNGDHSIKECNADVKNICFERIVKIYNTINDISLQQKGCIQVWQLT